MKLKDQNGREWRIDTVTATSPSGESRIFSSDFTIIDDITEYACRHPVHQPAYATTSDIEWLRQEVRANSIDINSQLSIIKGIILRLDALESKSKHRTP